MKIFSPSIRREEIKIIISYQISYSLGDTELWYSLDSEYEDLLTDMLDGPVIALLMIAMNQGENIYVDGPISERLFYNISRPCQVLLRHLLPRLDNISIVAREVRNTSERASGVATGFSGGVDSFSLLQDHYFSNVPQGFKITHLLFNNLGSHGRGNEVLFLERYFKNKIVTDRIGLPLIKVDSNLDSFYYWTNYQKTHSLRNASVPLILQNGIGRFLYASTFAYDDIALKRNHDMSYIDPVLFPLLSTESVDMISSGSEYTRVEKTINVSNLEVTHDSIDVCVNPGRAGNCSICWKCMRTLLTLDIAGLIDRYENAFDLQKYYKERENYIGKILLRKLPLSREIIRFAKNQNYPLPLRTLLLSDVAEYARIQKYSHPRLMCLALYLKENFSLTLVYIKDVYRKCKEFLTKI